MEPQSLEQPSPGAKDALRTDLWLSKTDVRRANDCLNAFLAGRRGLIPWDYTPDGRIGVDLQEGLLFDQSTREAKLVESAGDETLNGLASSEPFILFNDRLLVNGDDQLVGVPDGLRFGEGSVQPVEIKNHSLSTRWDRIDLAFYWKLLAIHQRDPTTDPYGWLILKDVGGSTDPIRVDLTPADFEVVDRLIASCRDAIGRSAPLRWCRCWRCSAIPVEQRNTLRSTALVSELRWVGEGRAATLNHFGYESIADLVAVTNPMDLRAPAGRTISRTAMIKLQSAAAVFASGVPRELEPPPRLPLKYLMLDLEYDSYLVWMATLRTFGTGRDERLSLYGDGRHQERLMAHLAAFLGRYSHLPVLTWGGTSADMPRLQAGLEPEVFAEVQGRHVDMAAWVARYYQLPTKSLGLKELSEFFGLVVDDEIPNGRLANLLWLTSLSNLDPALLAMLLKYNQQDVDSAALLVEHFRRVSGQSDDEPAIPALICDHFCDLRT